MKPDHGDRSPKAFLSLLISYTILALVPALLPAAGPQVLMAQTESQMSARFPARNTAQMSPQTAPRNQSGPIRIGATLSLTGTYAEPSQMMYDAYRLWESTTNEQGGLLGRPVELTVIDDGSSAEQAVRAYERFLDEEKVDLVLSPYGTPLTLAVSELTEEKGYVLIAAAAAGKEIWNRGYDYVFGMYAQAERFFIGFLDLCARNGLDSVSILYEKNYFNMDAANGAHLWAGRMGLSTIRLFGFEPGTGELPEVWNRVEEAGNEALVVCSYPPSGHEVMNLLAESERRSGYEPKATAMTITPADPGFAERHGSDAEGIFAPSNWEPNERIPFPGSQEFIEDFEEAAGKTPSYHAASAFASCRILEEAVTVTRSLDHGVLRDYIAGLNTVAIIGRFKVDRTGKQIGHNPMLIQWQDGEKKIVYPRSVRTAEPQF